MHEKTNNKYNGLFFSFFYSIVSILSLSYLDNNKKIDWNSLKMFAFSIKDLFIDA